MYRLIATLLALCCQFPLCQTSHALESAALNAAVETALHRLDATEIDERWHFTMTMKLPAEEEILVITSDPRRKALDRRQLLSVNGAPPEPARQKTFRKEEIKRIEDRNEETAKYSYIVDATTLQLASRDGTTARFIFVPRMEALSESAGKLKGTLRLDLASQEIREIDIRNSETLSPAFSVTLNQYRLSMKFQPLQGTNQLQEMFSHFAGKAGFFKKFDTEIHITFSDYRQAMPLH